MARALHRAIEDALHDAQGYAARGILVSPVLLAERDLHASEEVLYHAVYTLFCAMPWRLARGSAFLVATRDVDGGVELVWEGREERASAGGDLRASMRGGPHGDLVDIALGALERFCDLRAGSIEERRVELAASPRFPRGEASLRRVVVFLPASQEEGLLLRNAKGARSAG